MGLLMQMQALESVSLYNTRITDEGLKKLASHPTPKTIEVSQANCSAAAVAAITSRRVTRR